MKENHTQFPDWAPKELISTYINAPEPDPVLKRLLTDESMQFTWERLRKAGMADSPHTKMSLLARKKEVSNYKYVMNSPEFKKSPQGIYEYICDIQNLWDTGTLRNRKQNAEIISKLKSTTNNLVSLIRESGFDADHLIVCEYAKVKKVQDWRAEAKDQLIAHLKEIRKNRVDYPEISISELFEGYIEVLSNPQLTKIYHSPAQTKAGTTTFLVVHLSRFMRNFYQSPLHQIVADLANIVLSLSLTVDDVKKLIKTSNNKVLGQLGE